jgi:deoxyribodipyrimidine photo-lyase
VDDETRWVSHHLGDLAAEGRDGISASESWRGGQSAADAALAAFDVTGYARARNEVWPRGRRGASGLSPHIRHGLLSLPRVWGHVADGPPGDVKKFRDELLWQEYARHLYARLGSGLTNPLRHAPPRGKARAAGDPWDRRMACIELTVSELERDGWLVNQTRMWLASQWTVRAGWDWRAGEDRFFTHLLDGSRAANRLGWQWTVGTGTGRPYGFSRYQVEKRAPGLCRRCALRAECPIEDWPDAEAGPRLEPDPRIRAGAGQAGPDEVEATAEPQAVWLTAESLGVDDPASLARPDLRLIFVFDETLLTHLRLSGKRLVFLAQTLAETAARRSLEVHRGDPRQVLTGRPVAVTYAPVPGFRRHAESVRPVEVHPYPWLRRPGTGSVASYSAWRKSFA